tara:strand:+ start:451 stop:654 length:204 start_codon:yes stop_codon:yes gene_type:complete
MKCDAKTEIKVQSKETGEALPSEFKACLHAASFEVTRMFSGVKSNYCGTHAKRYQGNTAAEVVDLRG